jgi:hypothetical protein
MNHGRSFTIGSIIVVALYVVSYLVHAAVADTFSLPAPVLAVLAPLTPVVDYVVSYTVHGLLTNDWTPPLPLVPAGKSTPASGG